MVKLIVEIKKGAVIRIGSSQDVLVTIIDHDNPSIETVQQDLLMGARAFKKYVDTQSETFAKETASRDADIWHDNPHKILHHTIQFRYDDLSIKQLMDTDQEHVEYMIGQGFSEGDLDYEDWRTGYWKIKS